MSTESPSIPLAAEQTDKREMVDRPYGTKRALTLGITPGSTYVLNSLVLFDPLACFHPPRDRKAASKQDYMKTTSGLQSERHLPVTDRLFTGNLTNFNVVEAATQTMLPLTHSVAGVHHTSRKKTTSSKI